MNLHKPQILLVVAAVLAIGVVGTIRVRPDREPAPEPPAVSRQLVCGIYTSDLATDMYQRFSPLLERMSADISASLEESVEIDLRIFGSYEEALEALVAGDVDFARFGPASYVLARRRNSSLRLLAMEEMDGETRFDGLIVARRDGGIHSLADLAGKRFAFGDQNSTIGRYLAQERLLTAGIRGSDLGGFEYLGRHDKVVRAVQLGDFDAGAVKESTFDKLNEDGALIVLDRFENVTKPWVARAGLSPGIFEALTASLVGLDDQAILASFKVTRFLPGNDTDYDFVREAMEHAEAFSKP